MAMNLALSCQSRGSSHLPWPSAREAVPLRSLRPSPDQNCLLEGRGAKAAGGAHQDRNGGSAQELLPPLPALSKPLASHGPASFFSAEASRPALPATALSWASSPPPAALLSTP